MCWIGHLSSHADCLATIEVRVIQRALEFHPFAGPLHCTAAAAHRGTMLPFECKKLPFFVGASSR
jgi:hypothetical protein